MTSNAKTDLLDLMLALRARGEAYAPATVIETAGSSSASPAAKALIGCDGRVLAGWVGGGCAESAVRQTALECLGHTGDTAAGHRRISRPGHGRAWSAHVLTNGGNFTPLEMDDRGADFSCMINAKSLFDSFLGQSGQASGQDQSRAPAGFIDQAKSALSSINGGSFAGGAAAGGILGMVLGGKGVGKMAGGVLGYGGAAALGALAHRAYQNWQQGQSPASAPVATQAETQNLDQRFLPAAIPAADGQPFELALIRAMVGAAKADGHLDPDERNRIFERVETLGLDAEAKAFVFDALEQDIPVSTIAAAAQTPEQAAELYLAARMSMDPDQAAERAWLGALSHRLKLDPALAAHLDRQADAGLQPAA